MTKLTSALREIVSPTPDIRNFGLIIGAMKSGTTSLFNYLCQHPEIAECEMAEPHFFAKEFKFEKGMDWYRRLWKWKPRRHRVALEASTNYAKRDAYPDVPERIASVADDASFKFIYIMRNPVDRLASQYNHCVRAGWSDPPEDPQSPHVVVEDHAVEVSRYAAHLDDYMEHFEREDFKLLLLDDLIEEPRRVVGEVCEFLGVDPSFGFEGLDRIYNKNDDPMVGSELWTNLKRIEPVNHVMTRYVSDSVRTKIRAFLSDDLDHKYTVSEEQHAEIVERLRDDLVRLRDVYGVDVGPWELGV